MKTFSYQQFRSAPLPSQEEVTAGWLGANPNPTVSIICITYNQEKYIEDALRGFLIQKTNFPFEIIIHDDASQDKTPEIICSFRARYPRLIRPILQTINQFSQGKRCSYIASRHALGEYLALCEGDDFWVDDTKLQVQQDALRVRPQLNFCFHPCFERNLWNSRDSYREAKKNCILYPSSATVFSPEEIILGGGGFVPTASIFARRSAILSVPEWINGLPVGDYYLQILLSEPHGGLFLPAPMSFYRTFSQGSFSSALRGSPQKQVDYLIRIREANKFLDAHLGGRYHRQFMLSYSDVLVFYFGNRSIPLKEIQSIANDTIADDLASKTLKLLNILTMASMTLRFLGRPVSRIQRYYSIVWRWFWRHKAYPYTQL